MDAIDQKHQNQRKTNTKKNQNTIKNIKKKQSWWV